MKLKWGPGFDRFQIHPFHSKAAVAAVSVLLALAVGAGGCAIWLAIENASLRTQLTACGGSVTNLKAVNASAVAAEAQKETTQEDIDLAAMETTLMGCPQQSALDRLEETARSLPDNGAARHKYVYLTFDDGPSKYTPGILATLKKNGVKATFFVVYNKDADYYRQIVAAGSTIALHTYTHDYKTIYSSDQAFFSDLQKISDYVKSITGVESKIVRFAGGASNTISRRYSVGIMTRLTKELTQKDYRYFDWNAQCQDAVTKNMTPQQVLANVKSESQLRGADKPFVVLLLHNGSTEKTTGDALQSIIDYYRSRGYEFRAIDMQTPVVHQKVNN